MPADKIRVGGKVCFFCTLLQGINKKLNYLIEIEKVYHDADMSLHSIANKLSVSTNILSQVLKKKLNRKFSDLINSYRIEEAKKILQEPGGSQQKIAPVVFEVGFNTQVGFYNAFKKHTNMTPAQLRKKALSKKKEIKIKYL